MDSMVALGVAGNAAVMRHLRELTGRQRLHVIAESQAAAALVHAATQQPELFKGRVALLRPLGLVQIRKRQFVGRMTRGALQPEQLLDWRVVTVGRRAAWRTIQTLLRKGVQLTAALAWDIRRHLGELHTLKGRQLRIFVARRDLLYPPDAVQAALQELQESPEVEVIVGSHSSPATHAGVTQLTYVLQWCRGDKAPKTAAVLEEPSN